MVDLTKFAANLRKKVLSKVERQLSKEVSEKLGPAVVNEIMASYDSLLVGAEGAIGSKDPKAPSNLRSTFKSYIEAQASQAVEVTSKGIAFRLINLRDLGFPEGPDKTSRDKLKLVFFYIEGMIGDLAFVSKDVYAKFNPRRRDSSLGRFGEGFLIPGAAYRKQRASIIESQKTNPSIQVPPAFETVKHPLSGAGANDIFRDALPRIKKRVNDILANLIEDLNK